MNIQSGMGSSFTRVSWVSAGALLLSTLLWSLPLITSRVAGVIDLPIHYQWAFQFEQSLHEGVWLPRWNAAANQGLGDATFLHIHPLFYYLVALVNLALGDLWLAMRVVVGCSHLALGWLAFSLTKRLFGAEHALVSALTAQWAPYFLLMVVFGQALPTLLALPFAMAVLGITTLPSFGRQPLTIESGEVIHRLIISSFALAGLILSHVLVAFTVIVCVSVSLGGLFLFHRSVGERSLATVLARKGGHWVLIVLLASGLCAWYLVPAVGGRVWINAHAWNLGDQISPALAWSNNSIYPLWKAWLGEETNLILLWLIPLPVTMVCCYALVVFWRNKQPTRSMETSAEVNGLRILEIEHILGTSLAALYFASGASGWVWSLSSVLQQVQFPWRFLGVLSLAAALLSGHAAFNLRFMFRGISMGRVALVLTLIVSGYLMQMTLRQGERVAPGADWLHGQFGQPEYLPSAVPHDWQSTAKSLPLITENCIILESTSHLKKFDCSVNVAKKIVFPIFFHPGWAGEINKNQSALVFEQYSGFLSAIVPSGKYILTLHWGGTVLEKLGFFVTLTVLFLMFITCFIFEYLLRKIK